jgi:hypothetical protein
MPTHTIPSSMVKFFLENDAPWNWKNWQDITNVHHGLFPPEDNLLPQGITRRDVEDITSYFDKYGAKSTEDAKIKFASQSKGDHLPGRNKWRDWITAGWKSWNIHGKISEVLIQEQLHPHSIILVEHDETQRNPKPDGKPKTEEIPKAETYIPLSLDAVAQILFGDESLDPTGRLSGRYRHVTLQLVQRTWINITKQLKRSQNRLGQLEDAATRAFNGKGSLICWLVVLGFHRRLRHEIFHSHAHYLGLSNPLFPSIGVYAMDLRAVKFRSETLLLSNDLIFSTSLPAPYSLQISTKIN